MLNEKQYDMAFRVVKQVCKDIRARNSNDYMECPLRWSMQGGPVTGKSHAIKIIKT